jgi:hypothetical protein
MCSLNKGLISKRVTAWEEVSDEAMDSTVDGVFGVHKIRTMKIQFLKFSSV